MITRLRADLLLLLTALIWGSTFVAQKMVMTGLGPFSFVGARFALSALVVAPLAWHEKRNAPPLNLRDKAGLALLGLVFFASVMLQQLGIGTLTATNSSFLTSLYVISAPFFGWLLFRRPPHRLIWPACILALLGVWFLNGALPLSRFHSGDWLTLGCAVGFGLHISLLGLLAQRTKRPLMLAFFQNTACLLLALPFIWGYEGGFHPDSLRANFAPILYAGLVSGGFAYTIQAIAQQHTPPADAAIIMGGESLFAALFGAWLLHDRLTLTGWSGCGLIILAILLVEAGGYLKMGLARQPVPDP